MIKVTVLADNEGNWYLIPDDLVNSFIENLDSEDSDFSIYLLQHNTKQLYIENN